MKTSRIYFVIFISIIALTACNYGYHENVTFIESSTIENFPIPENAEMTTNRTPTNPKIEKYELYKLTSGRQELILPQRYLEEIEAWGWIELEEERFGVKNVFKKEDKKVWFIIEDGVFSITEISE
ncbi:hypothetical protein [Alkalihalobacterium chitinilyticum]|uniref:Lipoprotein n=1 Tax=Alkalihalobacterium chitinilyticum TaxID=2980103 RepID=A0ABT5VIK0_9BACI|nr:hypothetical protein [Alkalihalobacterium chitinilyticum]MDE5415282.1 hypothetical protein [Alkalihalobacterium chitinilyticum]